MTADELVAFAEGLSKIAAGGGGAKALAGYLSRRIHAAVLVEDAEWRHVAAAGGEVPSSVRTMLASGASGAFTELRNGRAGRSIAILNGELLLGRLSVFAEGDLRSAEHFVRLAACTIAVELARESGGAPGRRRAFWERLLSRAYVDAATARDDAAARGIVPATHYVAVALEPEGAQERSSASDHAALRASALQTFRSADAETGIVEQAGTILVFVPAVREIDAANARTAAELMPRTLAKKHPDLRLGGGVGTRVPLIDLSRSADQALTSLTIARRLYGIGKVGVYDDLGVYPLLFEGAGIEQLREFAGRTLAALRAYDEKHQTELEKTLRLYFAVGENVKTAAAQLNVHRHTVFYRLRQIGEICGCNLDDPHDQLTLRTAIAIDALTT